ncbi:molybdenum ABC transporter [Mobiluncus mulieris]|nr:molybdenum ABC transporter [Mobiluncus mulieris]
MLLLRWIVGWHLMKRNRDKFSGRWQRAGQISSGRLHEVLAEMTPTAEVSQLVTLREGHK